MKQSYPDLEDVVIEQRDGVWTQLTPNLWQYDPPRDPRVQIRRVHTELTDNVD